ncbi:hypothetical protein ACFV9C_24820 [Kribbella sp. NPDC059898]|uniref:hypothetical protein n=1 Tax=Kribbella sp. NPDC059898 TaxID=3346995 RepID=UPI0036635625
MPRRPAFLPATAALCALTALAACQGSPEAGHPNTPSTTTATTDAPTSPVSTTPSTPTWSAEEEAAISAATARYLAARRATELAMQNPAKSNRATLERTGNGGQWLTDIIDDLTSYRDNGWYQSGSVKLSPPSPKSVRLTGEPEVTLTTCVDSSAVIIRYQSTKKPVPLGPDNGSRHLTQARMVLASGTDGKKAWFLIDESGDAKC